eukprot:4360747-Amphidinium_carterae.1
MTSTAKDRVKSQQLQSISSFQKVFVRSEEQSCHTMNGSENSNHQTTKGPTSFEMAAGTRSRVSHRLKFSLHVTMGSAM